MVFAGQYPSLEARQEEDSGLQGTVTLNRMFSPCNDGILDRFSQIYKVGAVTGYPDQKVWILHGIDLGIPQDILVHNVELYVGAAQVEICLD